MIKNAKQQKGKTNKIKLSGKLKYLQDVKRRQLRLCESIVDLTFSQVQQEQSRFWKFLKRQVVKDAIVGSKNKQKCHYFDSDDLSILTHFFKYLKVCMWATTGKTDSKGNNRKTENKS